MSFCTVLEECSAAIRIRLAAPTDGGEGPVAVAGEAGRRGAAAGRWRHWLRLAAPFSRDYCEVVAVVE